MARYYQGPYWVRGDDDERWADENQRIGWTEDNTRQVARAGDHAWYWSEQQRRHVATGDGLTTTDDLAAQLAAGVGGQELAARFWVDAARLLSETAWADLQAVHTELGLNQRGREDLTPAERAMLDAAENRADAWGEASNRAATIADYGSEQAGADADAAQGRDHAEAQRIYQVLFDGDYYATIAGDGQAEDRYTDHLWAAARTHAAIGHTAAGLGAQRSADHAAIPADPADERAQRDQKDPTSAAWRTAVAITYREHVLDYGNDGRPEDDRHLSRSEVAARAMAITTIAAATGVPEEYVSAELRAAADAEGSARGLDNDPDYLAPPNWDTFAQRYKTRSKPEAEAEVPAWEREADQAAYWGELGESHPAVREAFWEARDDLGLTAEDDIDQTELDAAYTAAGHALAAAADLPTPDPAAVTEAGVASLADDGLPVEPPPLSQQEKAANTQQPLSGQIDNIDETELTWRTTPPTPDEWSTAKAGLDRTVAGGVADPGAWATWSELHARAGNVSAAMAATGSQMADEQEVARLHRDGAELTAEQREWVHGESARDADTWAARNPGAEWAPNEDVVRTLDAAERADMDCLGAGDAVAASLLADLDTTPPDSYPGDGSPYWDTHHNPDPVWWGPVAADLVDELDQARAQLEAGDIEPEREHELAEYIEHLEDSAHAAAAATSQRQPADDAGTAWVPSGSLWTPEVLAAAQDIIAEAGPQSAQGRAAESAEWGPVSSDDEGPANEGPPGKSQGPAEDVASAPAAAQAGTTQRTAEQPAAPETGAADDVDGIGLDEMLDAEGKAGEPSTEELVAAARDALTELAEEHDLAQAPVTDAPVVEDSAVADDLAPVPEMR